MGNEPDRFVFAGIRVDALNRATAPARVVALALTAPASYVCVTGAHGVVESLTNLPFRQALHDAAVVTPDGAPLAWFGRLTGHRGVGKVTGWPLVYGVFDDTRSRNQLRHFLVGADKTVTDAMTANLQTRAPGCTILGAIHPPYRTPTDAEIAGMAAQIMAADANVVWLGISTPRQEIFAQRLARQLDKGVVVACGAAFDFVAGMKPIVPEFMSTLGLEWLFRLISEPRRLWRRYAVVVPRFVLLFAGELFRYTTHSNRKTNAGP